MKMKTQLIATIVGALILFIWQFLSWSLLPVHQSEFQYTPNQDAIIEALSQHLDEGGTYMIPTVPPGTSMEREQELMKQYEGKPWASITYHKSFSMAMGMNLVRGFATDLVAAFLLVWLLMKFQTRNMTTTLLASISVGLIGYLTIPYLNSIWFETSSIGYLIDAVVQWGLVGVWLGWFLNRG